MYFCRSLDTTSWNWPSFGCCVFFFNSPSLQTNFAPFSHLLCVVVKNLVPPIRSPLRYPPPRGVRGSLVSPERGETMVLVDRDMGGDSASDIDSVVSATSAFSTQSEKPRSARNRRCFSHYIRHHVSFLSYIIFCTCLCVCEFVFLCCLLY